ncbi:MAG TPA: oligoendopeptidase F [Tepidisphaeraceae bacterium]|jgi:oligoendopeptidase F|nr:oligoendopeptidase F [Tepidisphaeraceae bacterium]
MSKIKTLPPRSKVKPSDCWDLASLYPSDQAWNKTFDQWSKKIAGYAKFKGKLGGSAKMLASCLNFDRDFDRLGERLGNYAFLKTTEDQGNSDYQRMKGRFQHAATQAAEAASWIRPEIMAIPKEKMSRFLKAGEMAEWKLAMERLLRFRPHTLGHKEEQLLAMQGQMSEASNQIFRQLNDADLKWGMIRNEKGETVELGHSSFSAFLNSPKRTVREEAFHAYYAEYDKHKNTMAASLDASVQRDVYYAKARGYKSAIDAALFPDHVPMSVYDNLIKSVHKNLPALHRYYELRRKKMKLKDIHHYDTYVPILSDLEKRHTWDEAVKVVVEALAPLGDEYCGELHRGMTTGRWCDRYPNQGKQSGAFSSGGYEGQPYILMNYQPDVLDHVFTLAHEAGHSMHSHYSAKHQPYQYYNYTIFVAEVASTFNEQLLMRHMMDRAETKKERAFLVNNLIDDIRGTIIRQTMFAEFEKIIHATVEGGEPLTVQALRGIYRKLLDQYFGPKFAIDPVLELECLRIPHFYRAFYVYKYATGLSAAIALSQRVLNGGEKELNAYLHFLQGGCSKFPLDLLRGAGVDMEKPGPVDAAMKMFGKLVEELDELL